MLPVVFVNRVAPYVVAQCVSLSLASFRRAWLGFATVGLRRQQILSRSGKGWALGATVSAVVGRIFIMMNGFVNFYEQSKHKDMFVILGSQGSGTNLLARFLGHMFDFSVIRDKSLIFNAAIKVRRDPRQSTIKRQLNQVYNELFPNPITQVMYRKHCRENFVGIHEYFSEVDIRTAKDFAYFFYAYSTYFTGKSRFAIQSDDIWETLHHLRDVFDNLNVILLTRDFRDHVLSVMHKNFGPRNVYMSSQYVKKHHNIYYQELLKKPDQALQIHYELLLTEPQNFIEAFTNRFGIEPVIDIDHAIERLNLRLLHLKKWEREMNADELLICESILQDELKTFGYELNNDAFVQFSPSQILSYRIQDCALRVPQKAKFTFHKMFAD